MVNVVAHRRFRHRQARTVRARFWHLNISFRLPLLIASLGSQPLLHADATSSFRAQIITKLASSAFCHASSTTTVL